MSATFLVWSAVLAVPRALASLTWIFEVFAEAQEMARVAHAKRPFIED